MPSALRNTLAVIGGILVVLALTFAGDMLMHHLGFFSAKNGTNGNGPFAVATSYRTIFGILGSYLAARLSASRPMLCAMILGIIGFLVSILGAVFTWNAGPEFGPHWYAIVLVLLALPQAWLGGKLAQNS